MLDIQLEDETLKQLEEVASQQGREVNGVVVTAIEAYIHRHQQFVRTFEPMIQRLLQEHAWLLDELAKR